MRRTVKIDLIPKHCCNVYGCFANSKWQPNSVFFSVPVETHRRKIWLEAINRIDAMDQNYTLHVCDKHFDESDFILSAQGKRKSLSVNAVPTKHLPLKILTSNHKEVQVYPQLGLTWIQTTRHFKSDMVVQAGPSFITEARRNQKLITELKKYQNHLKMLESGEISYQMDLFYKSCDKFLSPQLSELVKIQTKALVKDSSKETNYLPILKFCINLYQSSPRAYRFLKSELQLPSINTLTGMAIPMSTEMNDDTLAPLKLKVSNMADNEKYCSVLVDVMPLKSLLSYDSKKDKIFGFHEIDGDQVLKPTRRAVVVAVRGIFVDWIQPIGFSLISNTKCSEKISRWIDKILIKLFECGLKVKTFVCKKSKYLDENNIRSVSVSRPLFLFNNCRIYYMFDIPYMFRELRNTFLTHTFSFQKENTRHVARFEDVRRFYEFDQTRRLKLVPKLTRSHVAPTQSEKKETVYAVQLLSKSVATGLSSYIEYNLIKTDIPNATVDFLLLMNNLFDILNASTPKTAFIAEKSQLEVLKEALLFFKTLTLVNTSTGNEIAIKPTFVEGFQITINSILWLFDEFQTKELKYMTRRLNLEATETLIKKIKPKGKIPVSQRFMQRFRKLYVSYILQPSKKGTFSANFGTLLSQLSILGDDIRNPNQINEAVVDCEKKLPIPMLLEMGKDKNGAEYNFSRFLLKKCADYHNDCEILKEYIEEFESTYGFLEGGVCVKQESIPTSNFVEFVELMESVCCQCFIRINSSCQIGAQLFNTFTAQLPTNSLELPCPCFPMEFLQKLFIKLRIYMVLHYNNSIYRQNRFKGKQFVYPSL